MINGRLPFPITLSGDGLILREWRPDDLDDLVELLDEADVARWTPITSPFDVGAGTAYLERAAEGRTSGQRIQLAITTDGGRPLGEMLLFGHDTERHEAELGYLIGAAYRGRGLASRALALLSGYAESELALDRLLLRIDPGNAASRAVARRCGYQPTGEPPIPHDRPAGEPPIPQDRPAGEPPIPQDRPDGASALETWERLSRS